MRRGQRNYPQLLIRFFIPALVVMLPLLIAGGSMANTAFAGIKPQSVPTQQEREEVLVLRVYFKDEAERDRLAAELAAEEVPTTGGFLTVLADRPTYNWLVGRGDRVEIDQEQSDRLNDPVLYETFYGGYKTVEEIYTFLDQKVAAYPTLTEKVDIGDSWCKSHPGLCIRPEPNNGYDLYAMHITNRTIPGPKPVFWFDAGIHSREIATPEVAMRYINWLLDNYNTNADARWLVDHHDIWVMPIFNPDGHHIVSAPGEGTPYLYRKNGNNTLGTCSWPPSASNHHGVDDNRNFPFQWGCCGGSTTAPCAQTYRGTAANSEDETQAVVSMLRSLIPDQRGPGNTDPAPITTTGVYQNMHTVVPVNLIPWGWTTASSPNHADLRNIAAHMSATNAGGNGYPYGTISQQLYIVDGGSIDWAYGELGAAGVSTELSGGSFLPPYSAIEGIWNENRGMLIYQAKIARTPYLTTRGPDANLVATNPMTVTQGAPSVVTGVVNYNWTGNAYLQNVAAAEYYIDTPPWAGGTGMPMTPADGSFNSPTEAVMATIQTGSIAPGRHVVFVRGRGVNDYSGHQSWGPISAAFLDVLPGGGGTPTPTPCVTGGTTQVNIQNFDFAPRVVTITVGSSVNWTNLDSSAHTSTSTTNVWDSGNLNQGQSFSFTFTSTGSYSYFCAYHPAMTGTVNVVAGGCPTPSVVPPTATSTAQPSATRTAAPPTTTGTVVQPSATRTSVPSTATSTPGGPTPTACAVMFADVPADNAFYPFVRCLACRGIVGGYPCGGVGEPCNANNEPYFRPNTNITRGQIAKIVSESAGYSEPAGAQMFEDVAPGSTFYTWIQRLASRGIIGGYPCGGPGEPCGPENRPYYRVGANATRGQLSKIVSEAAGFNDPPGAQMFEDVPSGNTFYAFINRLASRGVIGGYPCGGAGEPCGPENRPYFRPNNNVTRGQASKIVASTFFPGCETR